ERRALRGQRRPARPLGRRRPAVLARTVTRRPRLGLVVEENEVLLPHAPSVVAGREAEDLGALHAFIAQPRPRQGLQPLQLHTLEVEYVALGLRAAASVV